MKIYSNKQMVTNRRINYDAGFTLIELLVVISIIGFLSSSVIASLNTARTKAKGAEKIQELRQIERAVQIFYDDNGRWPSNSHTCLGDWSVTFKNELSPYLNPPPLDPDNANAICSSPNWHNYYWFGRITWTWGACGPGSVVLASIGGPQPSFRNDCYGSSNHNMILLESP
jgi:prepilin-type N-terminal cleavage/methylation domain-containing protein